MKNIYLYALLIISPLIFSCQNSPVQSHHTYSPKHIDSLYLDQTFIKPDTFEIESEQDIFRLDAEMISLVDEKIKKSFSPIKKAKVLLHHIFSQDNIALSYASHANVVAVDAFHSQTANCLSLTIMAYALAKEAGLDVEFQQVEVPEYWVRNGKYNLLTGHINLLIATKSNFDNIKIYGSGSLEVDFDPYVQKQSFSKRVIKKNAVLAMFYNNKGGQALVNGDYAIAYQYFKAATQENSNFSSAWGNLAVLYKLTNHDDMAESTYRYAITLESNNYTALANLAILLRKKGNDVEANSIENKLRIKRNKNPYYHAVLADEAYYNRNYPQAILHLSLIHI